MAFEQGQIVVWDSSTTKHFDEPMIYVGDEEGFDNHLVENWQGQIHRALGHELSSLGSNRRVLECGCVSPCVKEHR